MNRPDQLTISLAQLNPCVGDLAGNFELARQAYDKAKQLHADILILPEMFLTGYMIEDMALNQDFQLASQQALLRLAELTKDEQTAIIVGSLGLPRKGEVKGANAAYLLQKGQITDERRKVELPNYGVFDEQRHFEAGRLQGPINFRGVKLGLAICEDMWQEDVCEFLHESGADILLIINGSPFDIHKPDERLQVALARQIANPLPLVYLNLVGGQDEIIFDGGSFILNPKGELVARFPEFETAQFLITLERQTDDQWRFASNSKNGQPTGLLTSPLDPRTRLWQAMSLALRDYLHKSGFRDVILGLSGGIDSALTLAVAADALGADRVKAYFLPSPYSSPESYEDALEGANRLGVSLATIPITGLMHEVKGALQEALPHGPQGLAAENMQARLRGLALMTLSNQSGALLLTTGNKSEIACGYATLYGDMCGGYSVLKDIYKTEIFALARYCNEEAIKKGRTPPIPERVITKPPSAELRPDQKDSDSLPDYALLDKILYGLIEQGKTLATLVDEGYDQAIVKRIVGMVRTSEYKRRQAVPGVKLTKLAFGKDWRWPIVNRYRP